MNSFRTLSWPVLLVLSVLWVSLSSVSFSQKDVIKQNDQEYFHITTFTPINGYTFKWYPSTGVMNIQTPNKLLRLFSGKDTFYAGFKQISFTQPLIQVEKDPYISAAFLKTILGITIENMEKPVSSALTSAPQNSSPQINENQPNENQTKTEKENSDPITVGTTPAHSRADQRILSETAVSKTSSEQAAQPADIDKALETSIKSQNNIESDNSSPEDTQADVSEDDIFSGMNLDENKSDTKNTVSEQQKAVLIDITSVRDSNALIFEFSFEKEVPEYSFSKISQGSSLVVSFLSCILNLEEKKRVGSADYLISRYYADLTDNDVNIIFTTTEPVTKVVEKAGNRIVLSLEPLVEKVERTSADNQDIEDSGDIRSTVYDSASIAESNDLDLVTVCIDAGHGGRDTGIVYTDGKAFKEKDITLQIALYLSAYLKKAGARVIMTRSEDVLCQNTKRIKTISDENINYTISLHTGFSAHKETRGSIVFFKGTKSMSLADRIHKNLYSLLNGDFTEPKRCRSYIFKDAASAVCLLELGFLSNKSDREYLNDPEGQKSIAKAIYRALTESR